VISWRWKPQADLFGVSVRESHDWVADVMRETGLDQRNALRCGRYSMRSVTR
jgi:hypothetical protein